MIARWQRQGVVWLTGGGVRIDAQGAGEFKGWRANAARDFVLGVVRDHGDLQTQPREPARRSGAGRRLGHQVGSDDEFAEFDA